MGVRQRLAAIQSGRLAEWKAQRAKDRKLYKARLRKDPKRLAKWKAWKKVWFAKWRDKNRKAYSANRTAAKYRYIERNKVKYLAARRSHRRSLSKAKRDKYLKCLSDYGRRQHKLYYYGTNTPTWIRCMKLIVTLNQEATDEIKKTRRKYIKRTERRKPKGRTVGHASKVA